MSSDFRQQLIDSVHPEGRELYQKSFDQISTAVNRKAEIRAINLRIVKGINQLSLQEAQLTTTGLATSDGKIFDCGAAMVRNFEGVWKRYSGKDSAHPTRLFSSYDPSTAQFSLWAEGDDGLLLTEKKIFDASILNSREGDIISAKFGVSTVLDGVLEEGKLTDHIRECLSSFEKEVENIGLLLRHPTFHRSSDTRSVPQKNIDTLYSDGAQIHVMNRGTVEDQQSALLGMKSLRAGVEFDGGELPPNIEDWIGEIDIETVRDGRIPLNFTSLTPRCLVTQRDVRTGEIHAEPKLWLKKYRPLRPWDQLATLGANVDMNPEFHGAIIRVGDRFTVTAEKTDWRT